PGAQGPGAQGPGAAPDEPGSGRRKPGRRGKRAAPEPDGGFDDHAPGAFGADGLDDDIPGAPKSRRARKDRRAGDADQGDGNAATQRAPQSKVGWSPYDEGQRSRGPLWASIGGVLVLGLLGGGLYLMWNAEPSSTAQTASTRPTSAPLPSAPPGKYGFAADRKTDPDAISVKEIFGARKKITVSKRGYEMTITSKEKKCADGALGDGLQKALKSARCTQFLRASFRDKDGTVIGTIGVANLSSSGQASKVAKAGDKENYVKPLAGKDGVTKFLGSGSGGAKIATYGHYAILVWFQNKDGTKPDSKASKRITEAINDLTKATVFQALDHRTLTGNAMS
ncbi:hypothetical protein ACWEPC_31460, partial [Nonomuraea sp. NPDC004297]